MVMTQKLIARMLGVDGDAVTPSATALATAGAIGYKDGRITMLDRVMLERSSCECSVTAGLISGRQLIIV